MRKCVTGLSMVALVLVATTAQAITVVPEKGEALINYGAGYLPVVSTGSEALPGSSVMLRPGATAIISYEGCRVRIGDQKVWSIASAAPCQQGTDFLDLTSSQAALPGTGPDMTLIIGGVVVAGAVAAAIALSGGDDDKCVSAC